ncbi:MAG: GNAT family N-acetyltransferase [Deltaproteobacteria bacterium]|nr:GNAT family N-acetyltransferase [Deltaproteobacteria bacterium]
MLKSLYWPDEYLKKLRTPAEAIRLLRPGQRIFIGTSCGEPQCLVRELATQASCFADLEIVRLLSLETMPLSMMATETDCQNMYVRSFYLGSAKTKGLSQNKRFITPIILSMIPRLFKSRRLPIHVALIQVSPPDDFGWMSYGISVDVVMAAVQSADMVIAQVNPNMPRVLGRSFVHVNDVNYIVEYEEELLTVGPPPQSEIANQIGQQLVKLIDDGSTLQVSLGATHRALMHALSEKNDLGVHTQFITDGIMNLISRGVINNRKKTVNDGKTVASTAIGSANLYEFLNDNPGIAFYPSDYVNDPMVIAQHEKMVSINVVMAMDLTGQAAADALPYNHYSGVTGIMDFVRGARQSQGGKSILMLHSVTSDGKSSRIVPMLDNMAVVVPRGDVHYVATEYGVVNLFGKTLEERVMALISIAHPDFRESLFERARQMGLVGATRTLDDSIYGVYPLRLESFREIKGQQVMFRPARPVDGRLLQEHFYTLDPGDVVKRFMQDRRIFGRNDVAGMYQVDYVKNLTIVAVIGEIGFERIIAVGGYYLDPATNMAEIAYSVSKDWQKCGLSAIIQEKLASAARDNGVRGFAAYTTPQNQGMIRLFNKLPYKIRSTFDGDLISLTARFDEPK